jgi:malonate transporter and related proteins
MTFGDVPVAINQTTNTVSRPSFTNNTEYCCKDYFTALTYLQVMLYVNFHTRRSMLQSFSAILPMILIILTGYLFARSGLASDTLRKALSDFCFYFGMPALLLRAITNAPTSTVQPQLVWIAYLAPIALCWIAASAFATRPTARTRDEAASIAMGATYGNVLMLGIPLAFAQFGPAAATTIALVVLVHSPVLFAAATLQREFQLAHSEQPVTAAGNLQFTALPMALTGERILRVLSKIVVELATNPIIIAIAISLALRLMGLALPTALDKSLALLGQATLPCVLISMGLGLSVFRLSGEFHAIAVITALKLVLLPWLTWLIATRLLRLPAVDAAVITLLSAMPTGANAFIFASRVGKGEASVSGAVAVSTLASAATITVVLYSLAVGNR